MAKTPEPQATDYRVVLQKNGTFGVEVTQPGKLPVVAQCFWTKAEAEAWVTAEMMGGEKNGN